MAIQIRFISEKNESVLNVYAGPNNTLNITINQFEDDDSQLRYVCLDKSTAIKLSREIRKQISFLED
jgi:hypothetical protein